MDFGGCVRCRLALAKTACSMLDFHLASADDDGSAPSVAASCWCASYLVINIAKIWTEVTSVTSLNVLN